MQPGDHLVDNQGQETPYRVQDLVAAGTNYQIARATDEEHNRDVALRAIVYGDDGSQDDDDVALRRERLQRQWTLLENLSDQPLLPTPVQWLEVGASPIDAPPEPLLICQFIEGIALYDWIAEEHPEGLEPPRALELVGDLATFCAACHERGWLWRDFDPRRFIIDTTEQLRAVSTGHVVPARGDETAPVPSANPNYTAPQLRENIRQSHKQPAADLYGLGALASFVLTGQEPRHRVESPLSYTAHQRLRELDLPGVELLVARLLQPMADKRLDSADELRTFCSVDTLPSTEDDGFSDCSLPAPWEGLDIDNPEQNRGLQSQLSSGPLVSMKSESDNNDAVDKSQIDWTMIIWVLMIAAVAALLALLVAL